MRQALHRSAADRDHLAARLVIIAKVVLLRLSIDNIEEKLLELVITRAAAKWFHNIKFEIAAEARTQFPVARETKFVTALAKMKVRHRANKADALSAAGNLVIRSRAIRSKRAIELHHGNLIARFASRIDMKFLSSKTSFVLTGINSMKR